MKDWHILITGGSAGIGLALAHKLAEKGAVLHLFARGQAALEQAAAAIPSKVYTYVGDTAIREDRKRLSAELKANTGRLDGLVVNAAKYAAASLLEEDEDQFEDYFKTNTFPAFSLVRLLYPLLFQGQGKAFLFVSSTLATRPVPGVGAYAASKAAMNSLAQTFALELAPQGIRVNAVLPGVVNTPIHDPQQAGDPSRAEKLSQLAGAHPIGRVGEPHDVASAACYLLSGEAGWVTGSMFYVDGGISLV